MPLKVLEAKAAPWPLHRRVEGLAEAHLIPPPDKFAKRKHRRGARAQGVAYEKLVGRKLSRGFLKDEGELFLGQWLSFRDANGWGLAQPDAYVVMERSVLLLEVKLTLTDSAWPQLELLYRPLLEKIYGKPVTTVQVCKKLRGFLPEGMVEDLVCFCGDAKAGRWVWHTLEGE